MKEIECYISGKVQGVLFRKFAQKRARELDVVGFIQNLDDGTVEVVAQGEEDQLLEFIEHLKKGPVFAKVDKVDIEWQDSLQDSMTDFTIEHL
jgi:acylphosphatase